jgi:hypothetical protein
MKPCFMIRLKTFSNTNVFTYNQHWSSRYSSELPLILGWLSNALPSEATHLFSMLRLHRTPFDRAPAQARLVAEKDALSHATLGVEVDRLVARCQQDARPAACEKTVALCFAGDDG